jgi:hypothetical protein
MSPQVCCPKCRGSGVVKLESVGKLPSRIYEAVAKAGQRGVEIDKIIDFAYADREDGGPLNAMMTVQVTICRVNKMLKGHRIKASRKGIGARYRVIEVTA